MTDPNRVNDLDLLAYADGLLDDDPARKTAVEEALASDPAALRRAEAFRAQTDALRDAYAWRLAEPLPEEMIAALERPAAPVLGVARRAAAVVVLSAAAGATGWLLGQGEGEDAWSVARLLDRSHAAFVAERPAPTETTLAAAIGGPRPVAWLAEEVSIRLKTPDLSAAGFSLVENAAVTVDGEQLVRLDYSASDGRTFSLFLAPRWEAQRTGIAQAEDGEVSMAYWLDGPLASTVVARLPPEDTLELAEIVRQALGSDGERSAVIAPDGTERTSQGAGVMADTLSAPEDAMTAPQMLKPIEREQIRPN